jgi:hypothetical protein
MQSTAISKVMVGGKLVVDNGRILTIDAGRIAKRVNNLTKKWERP